MDRNNCFVSAKWLLRTCCSCSPHSLECKGFGAVPEHPGLGYMSLCCKAWWWADSVWALECWQDLPLGCCLASWTPKARVFYGQHYFSPVVWLHLHAKIRRVFPLASFIASVSLCFRDWPLQEMTISLQQPGNLLLTPFLWFMTTVQGFQMLFTHVSSIPIVYLFLENWNERLWGSQEVNDN